MKSTITLLFAICFLSGFSQDFQGKAIYKTHRKMDMHLGGDNDNELSISNREKEMIKTQFRKTYTLNFNKLESIYKKNEELSAPQGGGGFGIGMIAMSDGSDVLYKNLKDDVFMNKTDIMGKLFLIKEKLPKYDWKPTSETKNIGIYTCYKATCTREIERKKMDIVDGEIKESKEKVAIVTTAWYTPQIPISNGPGEYNGLPGLILELNAGTLTIVCSEIVINPKKRIKIEAPIKGKKITRDAFEKIMKKKRREMMENFEGRGGKNEHIIEFGG